MARTTAAAGTRQILHVLAARPWLILLLLLSATGASAGIEVETLAGGLIRVQAEFVSPAPPALVRQVLTDYDHLAEFIPDMRSSRIVSQPGQPLQVAQSGAASFLFFEFPLAVVFQIDDQQPTQLNFHALSGNLREMRGSYRLITVPHGTRILYTTRFRPDFYVPPFIGAAIMHREIDRQFAGLLQEIGRRHAASRPASQQLAE